MPIKEFFSSALNSKTNEDKSHNIIQNKLNFPGADDIETINKIHKMFRKKVRLLDQCIPDLQRNARLLKE